MGRALGLKKRVDGRLPFILWFHPVFSKIASELKASSPFAEVSRKKGHTFLDQMPLGNRKKLLTLLDE